MSVCVVFIGESRSCVVVVYVVCVLSMCWGRQFHDSLNTLLEIKVPGSGRSTVASLKVGLLGSFVLCFVVVRVP